MTTPHPPAHYEAFKSYFENATGTPSLKNFVKKCEAYIVQNHHPGEHIPAVWSKRFRVAYSYYCNNTDKPEISVSLDKSRPDWGAVALNVARNNGVKSAVPSCSSTLPITDATTSSSAISDNERTVTTEFLAQFRATHQRMKQGEKWILPSGACVEDLMFQHGLTLSRESACHSFILDLDDPIWLDLVPDADDQKALMEHNKKPWPESDPRLKNYLESFVGKTCFKSLMDHARAKVFDIETEFDMDWAQSSIETALRLYPVRFFPLYDQTESDILKRVWIFIERAFDNLEFNVQREVVSISSSDREHGKNENNEEGLEAQKMLKSMLSSLTKTFPGAEGLDVAEFIVSGLKVFGLIMDRPSSYVCRITRTKAMFFPEKAEDFAIQMGSLITLVSRMKQIVVRTLETARPNHIQDMSVQSSLLGVRQLPPCATSPKPKPAKRARVSPP